MKLSVIKQQRLWWTVSAVAVLTCAIAIGLCLVRFNAPLRPGLDFIGGTRLQLARDCSISANCDEAIDVAAVRQLLDAQGLGNSSIQAVGKRQQELIVRTRTLDVDARERLQGELTEAIGRFDPALTQIDTVGPTIGRELFVSGVLALMVSFFGIVVYLSTRFQLDYAIFAILALLHDVAIVTGVFAVLGLVAGTEVNSLFLVALLTVVGFSVNDTVVIYDRIREVANQREDDTPFGAIVDDAVNQTLTRSINTTLTTLLPLLAIFFFGGETLQDFALALTIGFASGAYSSIFLASTLLALWRERQPATAIATSDET
ncbi:protein-export membrane protein, secD/secF family [Rubidibacter lacunae KORDI 51-2]|uniref:Protein-export membrane protein SecF n=1 Tax=Rubidibacter lacunae KORDI 51-2 TaxID=582515 RepID=U5DGE6_9CHRO|nr:protein translocase subunit SecF [Rubidibacter lacunae]ERN40661.1 protein-export membrane protein, secD/secF family [Rubidibacter lacunae KORDI 51-2]